MIIPKKTYVKKKIQRRKTAKKSSIQQINGNTNKLSYINNNNQQIILNSERSVNSNSQFSLASDYAKDSFDKLLTDRS